MLVDGKYSRKLLGFMALAYSKAHFAYILSFFPVRKLKSVLGSRFGNFYKIFSSWSFGPKHSDSILTGEIGKQESPLNM